MPLVTVPCDRRHPAGSRAAATAPASPPKKTLHGTSGGCSWPTTPCNRRSSGKSPPPMTPVGQLGQRLAPMAWIAAAPSRVMSPPAPWPRTCAARCRAGGRRGCCGRRCWSRAGRRRWPARRASRAARRAAPPSARSPPPPGRTGPLRRCGCGRGRRPRRAGPDALGEPDTECVAVLQRGRHLDAHKVGRDPHVVPAGAEGRRQAVERGLPVAGEHPGLSQFDRSGLAGPQANRSAGRLAVARTVPYISRTFERMRCHGHAHVPYRASRRP